MTKDIESETRSNSEPMPIGFFPAFLPNSSVETVSQSSKQDSPPYPVDISCGTFPVPHALDFPSSSQSNSLGVKLDDKYPPTYPLSESASAPSNINLKNEKGLTNFEREEIMIALSMMESKVFGKSTKERKEFFKEQNKVINIIDGAKSRILEEEKDNFEKQLKRINEIRLDHLKEEREKHNHDGISERETDDEASEVNNKCSFDITSLLLKFPQLVVDIVICVKGGMTGLTTISGAIFFIISLTAALFTSYFLILYCICRRTKLTRISAFGFLASVPYGSEVCWNFWNFLKKKGLLRSS